MIFATFSFSLLLIVGPLQREASELKIEIKDKANLPTDGMNKHIPLLPPPTTSKCYSCPCPKVGPPVTLNPVIEAKHWTVESTPTQIRIIGPKDGRLKFGDAQDTTKKSGFQLTGPSEKGDITEWIIKKSSGVSEMAIPILPPNCCESKCKK